MAAPRLSIPAELEAALEGRMAALERACSVASVAGTEPRGLVGFDVVVAAFPSRDRARLFESQASRLVSAGRLPTGTEFMGVAPSHRRGDGTWSGGNGLCRAIQVLFDVHGDALFNSMA